MGRRVQKLIAEPHGPRIEARVGQGVREDGGGERSRRYFAARFVDEAFFDPFPVGGARDRQLLFERAPAFLERLFHGVGERLHPGFRAGLGDEGGEPVVGIGFGAQEAGLRLLKGARRRAELAGLKGGVAQTPGRGQPGGIFSIGKGEIDGRGRGAVEGNEGEVAAGAEQGRRLALAAVMPGPALNARLHIGGQLLDGDVSVARPAVAVGVAAQPFVEIVGEDALAQLVRIMRRLPRGAGRQDEPIRIGNRFEFARQRGAKS